MESDKGILIVDDSSPLRSMVKRILDSEGLFGRFYEATDGQQAMDRLEAGCEVDMILTDLVMPKLDGISLIKWAREDERFRDLPILVLSVEDRGETKARGLNIGASDYVVKPFDPGELLARIRLLLRRKEIQDELRKKNEELVRINDELRLLASTDDLTRLTNRSRFMESLSSEMKRCVRYGVKMTLLMIDLDDFKAVNDTHGHLAGDEVLRGVAEVLRGSVRDTDLVGRYGGEEFVAYLVHTGTDGAKVPAERMRAGIQDSVFAFPEGTYRVTASIGMAEYPSPGIADRDDFIRCADTALYRAKQAGKNSVAIHGG